MEDDESLSHHRPDLEKVVHKVFSFRKTRLDRILALSKSIWNKLPLQVNYYYYSDVKSFIDSQAKNYDLLYCNLIRTAKYADNLSLPKVLDMVDSIGQNYRSSLLKTTSLFWRVIYFFEANRLLSFEKKCISVFDQTLFVNPFERDFYKNPERTLWTKLGVRDELFQYQKKTKGYEKSVCFLGKMNYQPNVDAVVWFCKNVLSFLPNFKFVIVGSEPTAQVMGLAGTYPNVVVTGFVEDPFEILNSSLGVVAPMQTGAGVQNKVLEAMALGKPVVVSSLAANAIVGAKNRTHFYIEDNPKQIAEVIQSFGTAESSEVAAAGRKFVFENYSWKKYGEDLNAIVKKILS